MEKIKIIEAFHSFQGEGPDQGKKMFFIRYKSCNRNCPWCDTQVKMRISHEFEISIEDIQKNIDDWQTNLCITGGEPTYSNNLENTIEIINNVKCDLINVETNGFYLIELLRLTQEKNNVHYILSPKIFNDDDYKFYTNLCGSIGSSVSIMQNPNVFIKLVFEERDLIYKFLDFLKYGFGNLNNVYLMPQGTTRKELLLNAPKVFDVAEKYQTNFSSREHVIYEFV